MAEFLKGNSETKEHAPLSSGQTLAVCQYLNNRTLAAFTEIQEVRNMLSRNGDDMRKVVNELSVVNSGLQDLANQVRVIGSKLDTANGSSKESLSLGEKLKQALKAARDDILHLRDGQKVTNTNVHSVKETLGARTEDIKKLRTDVDEFVQVQFDILQSKLNENMMNLRDLSQDYERTKKEFFVQKEKVRGLGQDMISTKANLGRLDNDVAQNTGKLTEACKNLETTTTNLEVTNAVVMKLNEAREKADMNMDDLKDQMVNQRIRMDDIQHESTNLRKTAGKLRDDISRNTADLEMRRQELNQVKESMSAALEAQNKQGGNINELNKELARVRSVAEKTKEGLEATNAMVLPNLGTSAGNAPTMGFHSAKDIERVLGKAPEVKTPRRRREPVWMQRNVGLVPDRMSYI